MNSNSEVVFLFIYTDSCPCGTTPTITNGYTTSSPAPYDCNYSYADYRCNDGYIMNGNSRVSCNRQWGTLPTCQRKGKCFLMKYNIPTYRQIFWNSITSRSGEIHYRNSIVILFVYFVSVRLEFLKMAYFRNNRHYVTADDWPTFRYGWFLWKSIFNG